MIREGDSRLPAKLKNNKKCIPVIGIEHYGTGINKKGVQLQKKGAAKLDTYRTVPEFLNIPWVYYKKCYPVEIY